MDMDLKEKVRSAWATLFLHNQNEMARINRAATAKAWGLEPQEFATPYTQQTITNNNKSSGSPLVSLLLGAVLGTGLLGAGAGLATWLLKPTAAVVPNPVEKVIEKVWDSSVEMVVEPPKTEP